jgi:hypothetical protein
VDSLSLEVGTPVFYELDDAAGLLAGVVTDVAGDTISLHVHQPKPGVGTWLPRWEHRKHQHRIIRARSCPKDCSPFTDTITFDNVVASGRFSGPAFVLDDPTIYRLQSLGYTIVVGADYVVTLCLAVEHPSFARF